MCGIAAIFAYASSAPGVNEGELVAIRDRMAARGPDGAGLWIDPARRVGLGHRRLSIIDVSAAGAQPMSLGGTPGEAGARRTGDAGAQARYWITFNGEIYNYLELRAALEQKGRRFRSHCDTEVLLHLYAEEGEAMLDKLRGMFAFAIWDAWKETLFLARDPFGIKPLYWADDGKTFRAASQVKALLAGGHIDTAPEPAGHVGFFLWGHLPAPYTLHRGIRALPAGHSLTLDAHGRKRLRSFCSIPGILAEAESRSLSSDLRSPASDLRPLPSDLLGASLRDSIRHHLIADVPVGVFLSSGLDSSTIAALASEFGGQLRTVTLGFEEYKGTPNDETPLAEAIARRYGASHQTIWVTRKDFERDLHRLFEAMDQPSTDGVNSYFISRAAAQAGLKVALSGLGGDELFGGYPSFQEIPRAVASLERFASYPTLGSAFRAVSAPLLKLLTSPKYASMLEYGGTYGGAYLLRRGMFMPWELPEILDPDLVREGWNELQTLARLDQTAAGPRSPHLKIAALEMTWYMRHQLLRDADWASMDHSLEVRVPFVDVELLRATAPLFARQPRPTKLDMARTPNSSLPAAVLNRPKTGFIVPVRSWLIEANHQAEHGNEPPHERGLRGWAKVVHHRFTSGVAPKAVRVSFRRPAALPQPPSAQPSPATAAAPRRILIFRIGQLGDTIVSIPAIEAVRTRFPEARLTLLCDRHPGKSFVLASDLLGRAGLIDSFLSYPFYNGQIFTKLWSTARILSRVRRRSFDTLVYLAPSGRTPAQVLRDRRFFRLAGIRQFIGMTVFARLPGKIPGQPLPPVPSEADLLLNRLRADGLPVPAPDVVQANLGIGLDEEVEVAEWLARLPSDQGRVWIGIGPGSKMPAKRWPAARFRDAVAGLIAKFNAWPVVFGGREDAALGDGLLAAWGCGYNAAGALSLRGAAAALRHCALLLTNDTGTMHLGAAMAVPCVAVFSSRTLPGLWNPLGPGHQVLRSPIDCEGCELVECVERKNECLQRITVDQVLAGCQAVLGRRGQRTEDDGLQEGETTGLRTTDYETEGKSRN